jgi:2-(1,2-epoxy-1,2-dihydrophenyl)acetyl-CoA isomerase
MSQRDDTDLLVHHTDGVLTLTMNRPIRKNALSLALYDGLLATLSEAAQNPSIGAIVLTGAGDTFSAGGDVKRMAGKDSATLEQRATALRERSRISEMLHRIGKPTIAMMRGHAIGAGLSLALACDIRYADSTVRLSTGFLKAGLPGDFGGHYFLPRLVGMAKARELCLTSATVDADEALRLGLVNRVFAAAELEDHVFDLARRLAAGPRTAIAHMKANMNQALDASLAAVLDAEAFRHARCVDSPDHREATRAFMEKRAPLFNVPETSE